VRIASLVPSATEMLYALGLGDSVVAVTHECDFPPEAREVESLTRSVVPEGLGPAEIDRAVRRRTERGEALYELDRDTVERLSPDLIVTQAVCQVCAVSFDDVRAVAAELPSQPEVLSLDPATLADVLADLGRLGEAAGVPESAQRLTAQARARLARVQDAVEAAGTPRVVALEWLDPVFVGGHWVPEMIAAAGGLDVLGTPGGKSETVGWDELQAARPEVALCMPCGYDAGRCADEARAYDDQLRRLAAERVVAVDASAYFSRPGPRLVDGVELLAGLLHPERVAAPATGAAVELSQELAWTGPG
jgi:iron complex transport system substrate-binding protein